jgi:hypothetical protein
VRENVCFFKGKVISGVPIIYWDASFIERERESGTRAEYMCGKKQMIILGQVFGAALVSLGRLGIPSGKLSHIQII